MIRILAEKIHDNRFLRLLRNMLQARYLEDWTWNATLSGCPQSGVVSPILSNIYLHKLDAFVEEVLIPEYTRGRTRARNPAYQRTSSALQKARQRRDRVQARTLRRRMRSLPSKDPHDPSYRRLRYLRYADDVLLGFAGPKPEAEEIKQRLARFLHEDLKLELNEDKTLITHARTEAARFLGYEITVQHNDQQLTDGQRFANGKTRLRVPLDVIRTKCAPYLHRGKPTHRTPIVNDDDYTIMATYGAEYRGIVQYYLLAGDVWRLNRLHWVMQTSLLKTLAKKHDATVKKMMAKHQATIDTPHGPRRCYQAIVERAGRKTLVARFGGIPLARQKTAVLYDRQPTRVIYPHRELITRLRKGRCELCGDDDQVQVHQISKLADLDKPGQPLPEWKAIMSRRRRKTLIVCPPCHDHIHSQHTANITS